MKNIIIHTATVITELNGLTSCGEARRLIERDLAPEQRARVLAQEARWEAFRREEARQAFEDETEDEPGDYGPECEGCEAWELWQDESMDGDHESALASAGFGTDEDYGCFDGGCEEW